MVKNRFLRPVPMVVLLWLLVVNKLSAQQRADVYFRAGQFNAAAKLYEKELQQKENTNSKSRLAYCYRMCNQLEKAFSLYGELSKKEQIKPDIFYYFAESLTQRENYDSAAVWFARYLQAEPKDVLNAGTALKNLQEIKLIRPYFQDIKIIPFCGNSAQDDNSAVIRNNTLLFTSDRNPGFRILKEKSNVTGRDYLKIYESEIYSDTSASNAVLFGKKINQQNYNTGSISFTKDGKYGYFERNSTTATEKGNYLMKIFRVEAEGKGWKNPEMLPFCKDDLNYIHPCISADGQELFFVSSKQNNKNKTDIYRTTLKQDGSWTAVENLGEVINTPFSEGYPYISPDGRLFFASKGHAGYGGFDLYVSVRDSMGYWTKPVNLGRPINSALDDISFSLFNGSNAGAFSSSRNGGDDDIYFFRHRDSSRIFQIKPMTNHKSKNNLPLDSEKKMSIDAAVHLTLDSAQTDFCSLFHYCTFAKLCEKLETVQDSSILNERWILDKISFEADKISKDSASSVQLNTLVMLLQKFPFCVELNIHCFSVSSKKSNLELSIKRSQQIARYLRGAGIEELRIKTRGMGSRYPLCNDRDCDACRNETAMVNDRIELRITKLNFP